VPSAADLRRRVAELRERIDQDTRELILWEEVLKRMEALGVDKTPALRPLRERKQAISVAVDKMNAAAHALATSGGRSTDALVVAANRHGYTLRRLAKEAGMSPATLSRARKGDRSLPRRVADRIERLIGFKATAAHWPGGLT
jgi:AraC-like DNA-binding protein